MPRKLIFTPLLAILCASLAHADRDIAVADLPAPITKSIQKEYPKAKIIKAEEDLDAGVKHYEVKIQDGDTMRKLHVRPSGVIVMREVED